MVSTPFICTFLLAIGTSQLKEQNDMFFSFTQGKYAGVSIIAVSFILIIINTYDGVRVINKAKFHKLISISLVFLFLFLTIKIMEMGWDFRIASY
jgi:uncharacterized spore protein YtfJ